MRSPFLSVASLAVDVFVGPVTGDDRVESFAAVVTLVAFPVPFAALCKHLFSSEYNATTTWTTFARWGLDYGGVDHGCTRSSIAVLQKFDQLLPSTLSVTDVKASSCTNDKINCLKVECFFFFHFTGEAHLYWEARWWNSNLFSFKRLDSGLNTGKWRKEKSNPCKWPASPYRSAINIQNSQC